MKEWFADLQPRERAIVVAGAIALALLLFYAAVWDPLTGGARAKAEAVAESVSLLQWMQQSAQEAKRLRPGAIAPAQLPEGQSLLGVIDQTAKGAGLGAALKRVKPEGENKVSVWLEEAAFDDTVRWLENLKRVYGVEVDNIVVDRKNAPGKVDARIELAGGAHG
jgi:general secretion pathway protein M